MDGGDSCTVIFNATEINTMVKMVNFYVHFITIKQLGQKSSLYININNILIKFFYVFLYSIHYITHLMASKNSTLHSGEWKMQIMS